MNREAAFSLPIVPLAGFFRPYSLADAEREIVAACIDNRDALGIAADILHHDDFRSHEREDLRRIFYVLIGWTDPFRDTYNPLTNRERLLPLFPNRREGEAYLESLWCSWPVVPEYVEALCDAITAHNRLEDELVAAAMALADTDPLMPDTGMGQAAKARLPASDRRRPRWGGVL